MAQAEAGGRWPFAGRKEFVREAAETMGAFRP